MRKIIFIVSLTVIIFMLTGCGAKQKLEDKMTEKLVEGVLGNNVDIDGDEVTIKGEEGEVTFGGNEWPDSEIAKKIPEFKGGKISSAVKSDKYVLVIIEEAGEKDFNAYYERVKSDFSKDSYDTKYDDSISYTGSNNDGISIIITYNSADKNLSIQASQTEKTE